MTRSDSRLVCGHRRLLAVQHLGWTEVEASVWEDMSEEQRHTIEREENERRKPLTDVERSKRLVARAKEEAPVVAAKMAERKNRLSAPSAEISQKVADGRGRPAHYKAPRQEVARALGVAEGTLRKAESHVAAVEQFPEIGADTPQATAIREAEHLRELPQDDIEAARPALPDAPTTYPFMAAWPEYRRLEAITHLGRMPEADRPGCAAIVAQPGIPPMDACRILANLATMAPERRTRLLVLATSKDKRERTLALSEAADRPPMPDPVRFRLEQRVLPEVKELHRIASGRARDGLALALRQLQQVVEVLREEENARVQAAR